MLWAGFTESFEFFEGNYSDYDGDFFEVLYNFLVRRGGCSGGRDHSVEAPGHAVRAPVFGNNLDTAAWATGGSGALPGGATGVAGGGRWRGGLVSAKSGMILIFLRNHGVSTCCAHSFIKIFVAFCTALRVTIDIL